MLFGLSGSVNHSSSIIILSGRIGKAIAGHEPTLAIRHIMTIALRSIASETDNLQSLLDHLERSYTETDDPVFFSNLVR